MTSKPSAQVASRHNNQGQDHPPAPPLNSFEQGLLLEAKAMQEVLPFIGEISQGGRFIVTEKGLLSKELQEFAGDIMWNSKRNGDLMCAELKADFTNLEKRNLFLETWSNRSRFNPGWMYKLECDLLLYYFYATKDLYVISMPKLKAWAFGSGFKPGRIYKHDEKFQRRFVQKNDTWGRCVPVKDIEEGLGRSGFKHFNLKEGGDE